MRHGGPGILIGVTLGVALSGAIHARGENAPETAQVVALLRQRCAACHSEKKQEAGLRLDDLAAVARGSENGPVITTGRLAESELWRRVEGREMPPEKPLSDDELKLLRQWVEQGAPGLPAAPARKPPHDEHWAFRPPTASAPPPIKNAARVRTDVDRFIQAALEQRGLELGPEADRPTLARRVSYLLTGLPPSLDELAAFETDAAPDAYERMVERFLASPRYAERAARLWLDVAGYADSNGYFDADSDRPLAHRYRDYVVRSFLADKPFDQMIREQIAGDELVGYRAGGEVAPEMVDPLIATHFLRNAPDGTGESDGNDAEVLMDRCRVIEATVQIIGSTFLGLTVQCARCHDHKFEPLKQAEYYQLQAILTPAYSPRADRWLKPNDRAIELATPEVRQAEEQRRREIDAVIETIRGDLAHFAPPLKQAAEQAIEEMKAERSSRAPKIAVLLDRDAAPPPHHVLVRGAYSAPGRIVEPGVPAFLASEAAYRVEPPADGKSTGRRLALARWLTSDKNPVVARLQVNRVWQQHFGVGLVASTENFGRSGERPSHPELLDHLAVEFMRRGWSLKELHRLIVRSATFRQSSQSHAAGLKQDPGNRLLWRFPLRRLDAEAVRDGQLAVSGELDERMYGPYVPTRRDGDGRVVVDEGANGARRRSLYLQQRRSQQLTMLEVFDAAGMVLNCSRRSESTAPLQSLAALNSEFALLRARAFAQRVLAGATGETERLRLAFRLAMSRDPRSDEWTAARRFLSAAPAASPEAELPRWSDLCQMLLASNAFLYVE